MNNPPTSQGTSAALVATAGETIPRFFEKVSLFVSPVLRGGSGALRECPKKGSRNECR